MTKMLFLIVLVVLLLLSFSYWYFENRYYCRINKESINVSLKKWVWYDSCLEKIKAIDSKIENNTVNINLSNGYINKWEDVEYWSSLKAQLTLEKSALVELKSNLLFFMNSFEETLFLKIKKLLYYHYKDDKERIDNKIKQMNKMKQLFLSRWNTKQLREYNEIISNLYKNKVIINNILQSNNFEEMVPFLRMYTGI